LAKKSRIVHVVEAESGQGQDDEQGQRRIDGKGAALVGAPALDEVSQIGQARAPASISHDVA
jgi:hypothetical protein